MSSASSSWPSTSTASVGEDPAASLAKHVFEHNEFIAKLLDRLEKKGVTWTAQTLVVVGEARSQEIWTGNTAAEVVKKILADLDPVFPYGTQSASIFKKNSDGSVWTGEVNIRTNEFTKEEMMIKDKNGEWRKNQVVNIARPITLSFMPPKASGSVVRGFSTK